MTESRPSPGSGKRPAFVFVSHHTHDHELAEHFSQLLSAVSAGLLKSFRSSDRKGEQGIPFGAPWFKIVVENLEQATDVVCILSRRSFDRPWILYEAGLARGFRNIDVHGVAF